MAKIVYESKHVVIFYREGAGDDLLITFSYLSMKSHAPDLRYFAEPVADKANLSALGIVINEDDWFAPSRMAEALEKIKQILLRYTRRIVLGSSMGGYGAIKYSAILMADAVLACVPQVSIQPSEVGHFDQRFINYYDPILHDGSGIKKSDTAGRIYLIYDPFHSQDSANVKAILKQVPQALTLVAPFLGHDVYGSMAGSKQFSDLVEASIVGDTLRLQGLIARRRRALSRRKTGIIQLAVKRHPVWGASILSEHGVNLSPEMRGDLHSRLQAGLAELSYKSGDVAQAVAHLQASTAANPSIAHRWSRLSWFLQASGDLVGAASASRQACELDPSSSYGLERFARVLLALGDLDKALEYTLRAVALDPRHSMSLQLLSMIMTARGDHRAALGFLDQAIQQNPPASDWWGGYRGQLVEKIGKVI